MRSKNSQRLEQELNDLLPEWKKLIGGALGIHLLLEVELATSLVNINGVEVDTEPPASDGDLTVDLVAEEEYDDNDTGKVVDEEYLGIEIWSTDRLL